MITEHAILDVKPDSVDAFLLAFDEAVPIISGMAGFRGLTLSRCVERPAWFLLLVTWDRLEDHTIGFRGSPEYQRWRDLLHRFYEPMPIVEHFESVLNIRLPDAS